MGFASAISFSALLGCGCGLLQVAHAAAPAATRAVLAAVPPGGERCVAIAKRMVGAWPDASTRVLSARWIAAGPVAPASSTGAALVAVDVPAHCELIGEAQEREGTVGQHYAIRFHLRLPSQWNGRLFFQGGGGSNGMLGDALGSYSAVARPALAQGFAVVSQDSGHDNAVNNDPSRGGVLVFGFDEKARANYGHASLPLVADAAKAVLKRYYGGAPHYSYFVGCSKGGEEGLALAERYGAEFDGIASEAPGMSLPRASLAEAWDTQAVAAVVQAAGAKPSDTGSATGPHVVTVQELASAFSAADLGLVKAAVLAACDADDGLVDGIVGDYQHCTTAKIRPQLDARTCSGAKSDACLSSAQIEALLRLMGGPRAADGRMLYSDWSWDTGLAAPGWRAWKLGNPDGHPPSLNVILGGASLSSDFTTPPTPTNANSQALLDFVLAFDFDRDAPKIYATNADFPRSAWDDISARSPDLAVFKSHGGKLLLTHGVSDPVFSIKDTMAWWREVDDRNAGRAAQFVRLFPVPGMTHCGGGDATDQFDVLNPLMQWVEHHQAPQRVIASAGAGAPWPHRQRPLCPYPSAAFYKGAGDADAAESFECR